MGHGGMEHGGMEEVGDSMKLNIATYHIRNSIVRLFEVDCDLERLLPRTICTHTRKYT